MRAGGAGRIYPLSLIQSRLDDEGTWTDRIGETEFRFEAYREASRTVLVVPTSPEAPVEAIHGFRFAIHAMYPDLPEAR